MGATKPPDKSWSPLAEQHPHGASEEQVDHPIIVGPQGMTDQERIRHLEQYLAFLWDQVWWMALPAKQRKRYESQGFVQPIARFYKPG